MKKVVNLLATVIGIGFLILSIRMFMKTSSLEDEGFVLIVERPCSGVVHEIDYSSGTTYYFMNNGLKCSFGKVDRALRYRLKPGDSILKYRDSSFLYIYRFDSIKNNFKKERVEIF